VEVGLSLLAQALMSLKFWDDAFSMSVCLIYRIRRKFIAYLTLSILIFKDNTNFSFFPDFFARLA
jgi:hypothetical protein